MGLLWRAWVSGKKQQRRQATSERLATFRPEGEPEKRGTADFRAARDEQGREVAVWRFAPDALPSSRTRRTFKLLLEQSRGLVHPAVLTVHEGGTDDGEGRPYLVTERVAASETARQALTRGPLPWEDALIVARDLLQGLAAGHARGLIHGALSPDELHLVRTPGQPRGKLQPFGFTRLLGQEKDTPWGGTRVDPEWAAPEVVKGEPVDVTADVYSAALLIHALLAGQHPVPAPLKDGLRARILDEPAELPRGIIPDQALGTALRQALRRALVKDPGRRCGSVAELEKALDPGAGAPLPPSAVLPDGGPCAGCAARIQPLASRTWDRHASDRPFKCSGCQQVFCGKVHWDARGFCCKRCADRQIAEYASASDIGLESSSDISLTAPVEPTPTHGTVSAGAATSRPPAAPATPPPAAAGSLAAERKRALLELAQAARDAERPSAESQRLAAAAAAESQRMKAAAAASESQRLRAQQPAPAPTGPTPLATTARAATEDAVLQAWADENKTREVARSRLAESNSQKIEKPAQRTPSAPRAEPAVAGKEGPGLELLAGVGLGFVVLFVGAAWLGDRNARREQERAVAEKHRLQIDKLEKIADEGAVAVGALTQKQQAVASERDQLRAELESLRGQAASTASQWEQERKQLETRAEALAGEATATKQKVVETQLKLDDLQTQRDTLARMNRDLLEGVVPIPAVEKRVSELDQQLKQLTQERNTLLTTADEQRSRAASLEEAAKKAEGLRLAAAAKVSELEAKLAAVPAPAPAGPAQAARVALALLPFGGEAAPGPVTVGAMGPWPARAVLRVPLAQVVPLLQQAHQGEAVVAVALRLDGERRRLRLSGAALGAQVAPDPLRPGRSAAAATAPSPDGLQRFWIGGGLAAAWLTEAEKPGAQELVFLLEPVPGETGEAKIAEAWLTATPLGPEAALRLRELERR